MSAHTGAITNYAIQQPSYEYTDRTTQFDDALLQRGIVTMEQVLLAKGMSIETAEQLLLQQKQRKDEEKRIINGNMNETQIIAANNKTVESGIDNGDSDECDDGDDEFLQEYRQRRLLELQELSGKESHGRRIFGDVIMIDRTEWQHHVNEDSKSVWVVIGLLSTHDSDRTAMMKRSLCELAPMYVEVKFVLISSHQAISNWPDENLPSLFLYRHGVLQHELTRLPIQITTNELEKSLHDLKII
jgi:Phosducin